jgi:NAD(P)-dependent dehydrogenase (short-subunit alcohol dehydrogenase family)
VNAIAPGLINTAMGARVPAAAKDGAKASALGRSGEPNTDAIWIMARPIGRVLSMVC